VDGLYVMAGGGTGGHVLPGLAVARELRRRGHSVLFVGTEQGVETRLAPREGFDLELLRVGALKRVSWKRRLKTVWELPASLVESAGLLERKRPRAVLSLGGYAAGPVSLMALTEGIPVVALEPNAWPGFTHRRIGPFVSRALLCFEQAAGFFPPGRWELTGVPIREEFFQIPLRIHRSPFTVLVTGGSQGSHRLNTAAAASLPLWVRAGWQERIVFIHQTGEREYNEVCARYRESGLPAEVAPFLEDMPGALARADLVVCRCGASTVAELSAAGRAALLVPFPFSADQHQLRNAEAIEAAGAARLVEDRALDGARLFAEVRSLLEDPPRVAAMEQAARHLARPGAARRAAQVLTEVGRLAIC